MKAHRLAAGTIWEGDWLAAPIEPGHTLAILDGPYGLGKAAWDRVSLDALPEWYAPHLARVSSLLAPSASLYVWNTAEGWARLDPGIRALGWTFAGIIIWDKRTSPAVISNQTSSKWPNIAEVCGFYTRGAPVFVNADRLTNIWPMASTAYSDEKLRSDVEMLRAAHGLEWAAPLHPCQKPLAFAERMIRASTRPGEKVLIPFGGTNREAVVMEWMARVAPEEARTYDACELNADGIDYIGPVLAQIRGEDVRGRANGQLGLFGGVE